jgi:hypothetical protein
MSTKSIDESLFGRIRRNLLCLFFLNPERSYFLLELVDLLNTGRGGVQRELANLVESGIITREKSGMKVLFSLSENCPVREEMQKLLGKLVKTEEIISIAVSDYQESIVTAVISDSTDRSQPVKLLVSMNADPEDFRHEIERIQLLTGSKIELTLSDAKSLKQLIQADPQLRWISDGNWKLLIGNTDDLKPEGNQEFEVNEPDLFAGMSLKW